MQIRILSLRELYRLLEEGVPARCAAVLSSSYDPVPEKLRGIPHLFRQYDDLDRYVPGRSMTEADAQQIARFLERMEDIDTLYCCCDGGMSRSAAVAAAACAYFGVDAIWIWGSPHYHPNMLVFELVTDALGIPVPDCEKDRLLYLNRTAFSNAIRAAGKK